MDSDYGGAKKGHAPLGASIHGPAVTAGVAVVANRIRLTIKLKDGRTVSGTYPFMQAVERLGFAIRQPNFHAFILGDE